MSLKRQKKVLDSRLEKILKISLECWKTYTRHKIERQQTVHKAAYSYKVRLKRKVLNLLYNNCIESKKLRYESLAVESTEFFELTKVRKLERRQRLKKSFQRWFIYTNYKIKRKKLYLKVFEIRKEVLIPSYIEAWRKILLDRKRLDELEEKAIQFDRYSTLRKFLKSWIKSCKESVLKKRKWNCAVDFHDRKLMNRFFRAWVALYRKNIENESKIKIRMEKMNAVLKSETFANWQTYVWRKKCSRRKKKLAESHYDRRLKSRTIITLKNYLLYRKNKSTDLNYLKNGMIKISEEILKLQIDKWRIALVLALREKQKMNRAEDHWKARQIQQYFSLWKEFSVQRKKKEMDKKALFDIAKRVLLTKYINLWAEKHKFVAAVRTREIHATLRYEKKLQARSFRMWKKFVNQRRIKKYEIEEAMKFHNEMLFPADLRQILNICLHKTEARYEKRLQSVKKNTMENFESMKKYFAKWLTFVWENKNAKKKCRSGNVAKKNPRINDFDYCSTSSRLVFPRYMLEQMKSENVEMYK